jgi:threonine dehydratase
VPPYDHPGVIAAQGPIAVEHPRSVCDGLCVQQLGETNFAIIRQLVDDIVVIDDALTLPRCAGCSLRQNCWWNRRARSALRPLTRS